jgi:hypothetical protein
MTEGELAHPRAEELEVGPILLALADANRRRVVAELAERPDEVQSHPSLASTARGRLGVSARRRERSVHAPP